MEIINETLEIENKEMLPQILMRIFAVCKEDPDFPLKEQMQSINEDINYLTNKLIKQKEISSKVEELRDDLSSRLQTLRQSNFELKSRLLEELGSDI